MELKRTGVAVLHVVALLAVLACRETPDRPADHVFINGGIYTVDRAQPWAQATAIADGEILYVGDNDGAQRFIGPKTRVTDLDNRLLLPGFHDAHIHLLFGGLLDPDCDLTEAATLAQVREQLETCFEASGASGGGWIVAANWDRTPFPGGVPHRSMLDELESERPVLVDSLDGHSVWLNSKGLELAGIDRETPAPSQGEIERDPETGEPTGVLNGMAMEIAHSVVPPPTPDEMLVAIDAATAEAHRYGITSVIVPGGQWWPAIGLCRVEQQRPFAATGTDLDVANRHDTRCFRARDLRHDRRP